MRDKIDGVLIDPDENGFHLILSGEEREYNFTLDHTAALALSTAVAAELSPWIRELQAMSRIPPVPVGELSDAYEPDDPKSEGYHDRMSAIWDDREK